MSLTLTIAGIDRTSKLLVDTLEHTNALGQRDTVYGSLISDGTWTVSVGQSVSLTDSVNGAQFGGIVDRVSRRWLEKSDYYVFDIGCAGWEHRCDRRLTGQRIYKSQTFGAIVADIVTNCLTGESITCAASTGPTIENFELDYATVTDALDKLCELASNGTDTYHWYITPGKELRAFVRGTYTAPFNLTDAATSPLADAKVSWSHDNYANRVTIKLGKFVRDNEEQTLHGDGSTRMWELTYPVAGSPSATLNGTAQTFGVYGVDTGKNFYWQLDSNVIREDDGGTLLQATDDLIVTYQGYDTQYLIGQDNTEIDARAAVEGGTGYHERLYESSASMGLADAESLRDAILARDANIPESFEGTVRTIGLKAGQTATVNLSRLGINASYLIESVTMRSQVGGAAAPELRWTVKAVNGALVGDWKTAFRDLAQSATGAATGAAQPGEDAVITVPGDITISAMAVIERYVENGQQMQRIGITGTAPSPVSTFAGVNVYVEDPDGGTQRDTYDDGTFNDAHFSTERQAVFTAKCPYVSGSQYIAVFSVRDGARTIRAYCPSYSTEGIENQLILADEVNPSPNYSLALTANPANISGEEYAPAASGFAATTGYPYYERRNNVWTYQLGYEWTAPTASPRWSELTGYEVVFRYSDDSESTSGWIPPDKTAWVSDQFPCPLSDSYTAYLCSVGAGGRNSIVDGLTPTLTVTLARPSDSAGQEYAPLVTGQNATISKETTTDGVEVYSFDSFGWTAPTDDALADVHVWVNNLVDDAWVELGQFDAQDNGPHSTAKWPLDAAVNYTMYFYSRARDGRENTHVAGVTPSVSGLAATPSATGTLLGNRLSTATLGTALGVESDLLRVKIAGPLYADISNNLNIQISSDFVVSGGILTQSVIDLAKAVNFNTSEFTKASGLLAVNTLALNKLIAGDALFAGQATFAYNGGGKLTINSSGLTVADHNTAPTCTLTLSSTGITVARSANSVQITSSGVAVSGGGKSLTLTSGGVVAASGANSLQLTSSSAILTDGTRYLTLSASGLVASQGSNYVQVSASSVSVVGGGQSIVVSASGIEFLGGGSLYLASGGNISVTPGYVSGYYVGCGAGGFRALGVTAINSSAQFVGLGINLPFGSVIQMNSSTVINASAQFTGSGGVACPSAQIIGAGFNPYAGGVQYYGYSNTMPVINSVVGIPKYIRLNSGLLWYSFDQVNWYVVDSVDGTDFDKIGWSSTTIAFHGGAYTGTS